MAGRGTALIAALYGLLAVVLAALGAHALPVDNPEAQKLWATALQMHMFHTVALLAIAALAASRDSVLIPWSGLLMAAGVFLFSGNLYLRAIGLEFLPGPLTPFGGVLLMLSWVMLFIYFWRAADTALPT
jgi:uncharacterized membrane protein YgdD (TMEM256/DUF423 family)